MSKYLIDLEGIKLAILSTSMFDGKLTLINKIDNILQNMYKLQTNSSSNTEDTNILCHNVAFDLGVLSGILKASPTLEKKLPRSIKVTDAKGNKMYKLSTSKNDLVNKCKNLLISFNSYGKFMNKDNTDDILFELDYHVSKLEVLSDFLKNTEIKNDFANLSDKIKDTVTKCRAIIKNFKRKNYSKVNDIRFCIGEIAGILWINQSSPILLAKELDSILDLLLEL